MRLHEGHPVCQHVKVATEDYLKAKIIRGDGVETEKLKPARYRLAASAGSLSCIWTIGPVKFTEENLKSSDL